MTKKAEFNAKQWSTVVEGPMFAGMWVMAAERGGSLRESVAIGRVYAGARESQGSSELLDELVSSPPALDRGRAQEVGADVPAAARDALRRAMEVVEAAATAEEADAYKRFVMTVAQAAAEAHKEGGFLGVGGKPVSEAEDRALDEISTTLGAPPA